MKRFNKQLAAAIFSLSALCFSMAAASHQDSPPLQQSTISDRLLDRVRACVLNSSEIIQKDEIIALLDVLEHSGVVSETGSDNLRVKYVHAQGIMEHVLASAMVLGEIDHLVGIIHTPMPATPLCTKVDDIDSQLLDDSIRNDQEKLLTVRSRAVIVREYLEKGGRLFIVYPKGGFEKRSAEQLEIYRKELEKYPGNLFDVVLGCAAMDPDKVGATYFFRTNDGAVLSFSIKSKQANAPSDDSEWALWFGEVSQPVIQQRVNEVLDYLEANKIDRKTILAG